LRWEWSEPGRIPNLLQTVDGRGAVNRSGPGRVLIVEPTYKPRWEIPGGRVERGELSAWAFPPPEEMFVMMTPRLVRRVTAALDARDQGVTVYLEHGVPADSTDGSPARFG
jgi:hypothetical protein